VIRLNVPKRKNAIRLDTYRHLAEAFKEADEDQRTKITVITGQEQSQTIMSYPNNSMIFHLEKTSSGRFL
jgi:1,4-dihydroxy-2-naphthoyl-CoA synthase